MPKSKHGAPMAWLKENVRHRSEACLSWPFARSKRGYGNIRVGERYTSAHRVMCSLAHGEAPFPGAEAAHTCGKGHEGCVNPQHLEWKSCKSNHADKIAHGTMVRGERQHMAALTAEQVLKIYLDERPTREIANEYGCTPSNISHIRHGKSWAWLTNTLEAGV